MTEQDMTAVRELEFKSIIDQLSDDEVSSLLRALLKYRLGGGDLESVLAEWKAECERQWIISDHDKRLSGEGAA